MLREHNCECHDAGPGVLVLGITYTYHIVKLHFFFSENILNSLVSIRETGYCNNEYGRFFLCNSEQMYMIFFFHWNSLYHWDLIHLNQTNPSEIRRFTLRGNRCPLLSACVNFPERIRERFPFCYFFRRLHFL